MTRCSRSITLSRHWLPPRAPAVVRCPPLRIVWRALVELAERRVDVAARVARLAQRQLGPPDGLQGERLARDPGASETSSIARQSYRPSRPACCRRRFSDSTAARPRRARAADPAADARACSSRRIADTAQVHWQRSGGAPAPRSASSSLAAVRQPPGGSRAVRRRAARATGIVASASQRPGVEQSHHRARRVAAR